jgi:hypothetical protein
MPSYDDNAYYNPEDHNPPLETVAHFEAYTPEWSFDLFIVVREKGSGKLYAASDSGCSCPTPFEDHTWPTDYTEIKSWEDCKRELDRAFPVDGYRARKPHDALRRAVKEALRG